MKSALALTVIVCVVASPLPVTAQQPTETPGLLGIAGGIYGFRAANRETEVVIYRAP